MPGTPLCPWFPPPAPAPPNIPKIAPLETTPFKGDGVGLTTLDLKFDMSTPFADPCDPSGLFLPSALPPLPPLAVKPFTEVEPPLFPEVPAPCPHGQPFPCAPTL